MSNPNSEQKSPISQEPEVTELLILEAIPEPGARSKRVPRKASEQGFAEQEATPALELEVMKYLQAERP
jgi:hypothetical protein